MMRVTHIRKVTPQHFANWIEKQTLMLPYRYFPTERGRYCLQQARADNPQWNPSRIRIEAIYVYPSREDPHTEIAIPVGEAISFDLIPLDSERTEITTSCISSPPILEFWNELLADIEKRWKAESPSQGKETVHTDTPTSSDDAAKPEKRKVKKRGGRPRNPDDEWARAQVHKLGRNRQEVYKEWLARIGERAKILADPQDSFDKAVGKKPKKGE